MNRKRLKFRHSRRDLYDVIRITAAQRPMRRVALPALAGFVFLGHAIDGHYLQGLLWAAGTAVLYWGICQVMFLLNVYGSGNETLLAPQEITLDGDHMVVISEHGVEEFDRPDPAQVKTAGDHVVIRMGGNSLVFLKRSFDEPGDYEILRDWLRSGQQGAGGE